ncbi:MULTISPECIES: DUF4136 domain-containing protein [Roseateles]|uniref:DUF4136 domain-containing protein n=1 Tax=Roseateles albus TaxID=2987525 RepID=A0ABT5KE56_9BURK|nr:MULTISPECIES: DUF4136 domain-containing protein [Roseateles]MCV2358467.1 DUF4136 domain-containing protein [Paucibacter sp. TC2R-5]MDC8772203.1 DUF4136 domain-containing protein [Roseateles albus]
MKNCKNLLRLTFALTLGLGGLGLSGCATGPQVQVEMDRSADFGQYKTFAFVSPLGTDRSGYQTIVSGQLKASAQRELEARGLRYDAAAPQLLINFNASLSEKLRVSPGPSYGIGYYGYRGGLYAPWPYYRDMNSVSQYTEGTLNIDVVDAVRKQMVWEGVVTGTVSDHLTPEQTEAAINRALAAAFVKFPIGSTAPAAKAP